MGREATLCDQQSACCFLSRKVAVQKVLDCTKLAPILLGGAVEVSLLMAGLYSDALDLFAEE